jgi:NitT/TauT family transport system substrate-binding protein
VANLSRSQLLVATAALALAPRAVGAQTLEKLRMCGIPTDDMTPIYYAVKSGMYQKAGIDLEIVPMASGSASTAAVIGGAYELGKASPVASLLAHLKGLPLTIVANGSIYNARAPFSGMLVAVDSPIKTAADCNGKTGSAASLFDISHLAIMNWVDKNGGDSKSMKFVEAPGSVTAAALAGHRIDVSILNEPYLSAALATGKVRLIADGYAAVAERWLTSGYLAQPEFTTKHADLMRQFARVTYESAAYAKGHESETAPMMAQASKIPLPVFAKMNRIEGSTTGDPTLLQPVIELAAKYKVIARAFAAKEMYWNG